MHHIYPKGDQLCPLGFHPQVRWPTRCKRCFRDYKEHGNKRNGEDIASSTPSLSASSSARDNKDSTTKSSTRNWTSSTNLSSTENSTKEIITIPKRPSSWASAQDLDEKKEETKADISVSISLPKRRHTVNLDLSRIDDTPSITIKRPPVPPREKHKEIEEKKEEVIIYKTDSLAERVRKMQVIKKQGSVERESSKERTIPRKNSKEEPKKNENTINEKKKDTQTNSKSNFKIPSKTSDLSSSSQDVQFLIQVKNSNKNSTSDDSSSFSTCTDTTETTIVGSNDPELLQQIEILKRELDSTKQRCERAERDKSDILLRRLASLDTISNRTAATEALKLQQKVNDLNQQVEELSDEKKFLSLRLRELEHDLSTRPEKNIEEQLRAKLQAAETLCEELMDENEDMKRELHNMEHEIDEMQDNFREDQVDEYTTMKKELEQTTKNCRILSFKLKKSERKIEQLEGEKQVLGTQLNSDLLSKIKILEEELKAAHEVTRKLQTEAEQAEKKSNLKKKAPTLEMIGKSTSADGKFSRESMTRGGSQDDPAKLLRDLQDSLEREADLREQLKYTEEEAENLRKKSSRVDDENESLMMQLKKMATKARSRKLSPTAPINRLSPTVMVEKDEGISDEEDPAELRVLLELNEQEAAVLRRKVEELETENTTNKKLLLELQEKMKSDDKSTTKKLPSFLSKSSNDKKIKSLEDEVSDLKKKLTDRDKVIDKLQSEQKIKGRLDSKSKSPDTNEQQSVDVKRQLQIVEQEQTILRTKIINLEKENDALTSSNKKLSLQAARTTKKDGTNGDTMELLKLKEISGNLEKENNELKEKLKKIIEDSVDKMSPRTPKKYSDSQTKFQCKKMIEDLEEEIGEMRAMVVRTGGNRLKKIEAEKATVEKELKEVKELLGNANNDLKLLKSKQDSLNLKTTKLVEIEFKLKKTETEKDRLNDKIKQLEEKIGKQDGLIKQTESIRSLLESQNKNEKETKQKLEKELEKEKKDRMKCETKIAELDTELQNVKKSSEKLKISLEKEISALKKSSTINSLNEPTTKKLQELKNQVVELETNLTKESKKYNDLTGKYEVLEEEHVLTKAKLTSEKEKLSTETNAIKSQLNNLQTNEGKLKEENDRLNKKLQEIEKKLKNFEKSDSQNTTSMEYEKNKYKGLLEAKNSEIQRLKHENESNNALLLQLKRDNDGIRRKLDDFEKVNKVHRSLNDHNQELEQELKKMELKLENAEHNVKSEVAATRLRYEQQITNLQSEMGSLQRQCERFKRDRDSFKQLLEAAQTKMAEMKQNSGRASRSSNTSGDEDDKSKILGLEQQIGCLEDELSEARLDASKLKTELVSEKSASEIKLSEMQSKLNEHEEERLIGSGRTKIPGMKTRLELSWQKEREELTRLLQETSTLARDLRQTLFEVERERDKDKLESKRKHEQLKKGNEEEMEEGRRKISELQCDLLELRDAHAKLRTANEKLRRERERFEREKDSATKRRLDQDGDRKVGVLLQTVEEFVKMAPDLQLASKVSSTNTFKSNSLNTPNPPRRSKSPSPSAGQLNLQISDILGRLGEAYEELRKYQKLNDEEKERERYKRGGMRRAASTENEEGGHTGRHRVSRNPNGSLYRKSLSLDQSIHQDQLIWKQDEGSMSSIQSIDSEYNGYGNIGRESSMDSRLSAGSTQSDLPRGPRKKKRGLMGKLRSLAKSRGAESDGGGSQRGSDSDLSITGGDHRSSKKDLKERLSGMFRRSATSSRQNSNEQLESIKRPVAVTVNTIENGPKVSSSTPSTPHLKRTTTKPPTPASLTPSTPRRNK